MTSSPAFVRQPVATAASDASFARYPGRSPVSFSTSSSSPGLCRTIIALADRSRAEYEPKDRSEKNAPFTKLEDQREFWNASAVCRNPLAFASHGCQQLSTRTPRRGAVPERVVSGTGRQYLAGSWKSQSLTRASLRKYLVAAFARPYNRASVRRDEVASSARGLHAVRLLRVEVPPR
jgi:hypothetical protein